MPIDFSRFCNKYIPISELHFPVICLDNHRINHKFAIILSVADTLSVPDKRIYIFEKRLFTLILGCL